MTFQRFVAFWGLLKNRTSIIQSEMFAFYSHRPQRAAVGKMENAFKLEIPKKYGCML